MQKLILNKKTRILEVAIVVIVILVGAGLRILPHLPNFAPIVAIALFSGVYFSKKVALILPLAAMIISDIFIGYYDLKLMATVYGSFLLITLLGVWLKGHKKWPVILGSSLVGSLTFFFLTNLAAWAFTPWYAKTLSGILQCYLMALPFFRNALLGDLFYVIVFFGLYGIIEILVQKRIRIFKTVNFLA
ncbi:MAG: DUF6580 family putative transport protein [Patescibacteria group bacterium]